jgi:hypothetical protein
MMSEVFAPGRPGFTLILLLGIGLFSGSICLILDAINAQRFAGYAKLVSVMSCVCIVLDVMYQMLSKFLKLFGMSI